MIVVYVFLALVLLRFLLIGIGAALLIRPVSDCPACFQQTVPIRLARLARLLPWLEWRWCASCGWQGPARKQPPRQSPQRDALQLPSARR